MEDAELIERIVKTEQRTSSNTKRINEMEQEVKENRELTIAVKEMATEMKYLREDQNGMNERLKAIEQKPIKEYEEMKSQIKKQVVSFFVGILLTALAFILGLKKFT